MMADRTPTATHKGLMYGVVPIYLDMSDANVPAVWGRFPGCDAFLTVMDGLFAGFCMTVSLLNPDFEPAFPIRITGSYLV